MVVPTDGREPIQTSDQLVEDPARYLPDGAHIAFSGAASGPFADVYTSLPDGTDTHRVTSTPDNEIRVEWGDE